MTKLFELLKFDKKGLIPAVIQDEKSNSVLTLCYMNRQALKATFETGNVHVYRRSKGKIMMKGSTSGCIQKVKSVCIDCEGNSLLINVAQHRAACHEGYFSCYFRKIDKDGKTKIIGKKIFNPEEVY